MGYFGGLILVGSVTCILSFGVQCGFFVLYKLTGNPIIKNYKHVFSYTSGVIGDGLLVPLVNIFAFLTLTQIGHTIPRLDILILGLIMGFGVTFIAHWGQRKYDQKNWTMLKRGEWNNLGLYHAIFMFLESSFLGYTLIFYIDYLFNPNSEAVFTPFWYAIFVLLLFALTFIFDYWDCLFKGLLKKYGVKLFKSI